MSPFGLPLAGYPASARWHVFRFQIPLSTLHSNSALSLFSSFQSQASKSHSTLSLFTFSSIDASTHNTFRRLL